ncbi:hypothetical protein RJ639_006533 [Escallonia herrerae]|uniref:Bifunctional inhibitor/plant lipid transfer protein/seed storage helical domain-containing protein n=1 Tax=Escallonia herrerae TaxID=1293975 RepID=A0AA88VXI3_9ASTE|nr:hypothetical protein RJ639_006533 [Escallonia herrerae]
MAVTCSALQLSPCASAITSASTPSPTCCSKIKEQRPCLCKYLKDPNLKKFISSPNARKECKPIEFHRLVNKHKTKKNQGLKWVVVVLVVAFGEGSDDGVPRKAIGWVHLVQDVVGVAKITVLLMALAGCCNHSIIQNSFGNSLSCRFRFESLSLDLAPGGVGCVFIKWLQHADVKDRMEMAAPPMRRINFIIDSGDVYPSSFGHQHIIFLPKLSSFIALDQFQQLLGNRVHSKALPDLLSDVDGNSATVSDHVRSLAQEATPERRFLHFSAGASVRLGFEPNSTLLLGGRV